MKAISKMLPGALALAAATVLGLGSGAAQAQDKTITLCWAAWDPANALVELSQGLHRQDRRQDEVRVRALAELRRPHAQRAQLEGQAVRPDHRRQPVDRRRGRERPLRQAQRLLRQGRHQDERLHAGHRGRLCRVAEEHAELLGAAGDGRRGRLDLSQGLVRQARAAGRVQEEVQPRPRAAEDLGRVQAGRRVLPGPQIDGKKVYGAYLFTERGSEGITMGVTNVLYPYGLQVRGPEEAVCDGRLRQLARRGQGPRVLQGALQVLHAARPDQRLHGRGPGRLQVGPGRDDDELVRLLPGPLQGPERRRRQDRLLRQSGATRARACSSAARASRWSRTRRTATRRCSTSSGSPRPRCRRSGGRSAATRATRRCCRTRASRRARRSRSEFLDSMDMVVDFWAEPSLCAAAARRCRSACTTTSSPTRARPRKRSTRWSPTGRRCSRKTAS